MSLPKMSTPKIPTYITLLELDNNLVIHLVIDQTAANPQYLV